MTDIQFFSLGISLGFASFVATMLLATPFTNFLYKNKLGKQIRTHAMGGGESPLFAKMHQHKIGTPTMGGILVWGTALVLFLLSILVYIGFPEWFPKDFLQMVRGQLYLPMFTLIAVAVLGMVDDFYNIRQIGGHKGIPAKIKAGWQLIFAGIGAIWFYEKLGYSMIHVPGVGDFDIGLLYIPLFMFVFVGSSNAVNITDGLDGLAGGLLIFAFMAFGVLSYAQGLFLLALFCVVISGALLTFLWFNIPPARFYMGDTGSLALGATLGVIAMMTNMALVLPIIGFVFVLETLSVIMQVGSKKIRNGKKIFHVAPIHHHFEYIGWSESKVVMRAWIIGIMSAGLGIIVGLL